MHLIYDTDAIAQNKELFLTKEKDRQHYETQPQQNEHILNGYMLKDIRPKTEWGRNKTYYEAIFDWASLPSELKRNLQ